MKTFLSFALGLSLLFGLQAKAADYEQEMATIAQAISASVSKAERKKISVLDFTDLQGTSTELGRFLAEELSVSLVIGRKDFSVLDRANLKSILAEHKLTAEGLVNPANAKQLGQFAGVDAIVMGSITPLKDDLIISIKIVTTDTAEIVGAARGKISKTTEIQQLLDHGLPGAGGTSAPTSGTDSRPAPEFSAKSTVQKFGNFNVALLSFRVLPNGNGFAALQILNTSKQSVMGFAANGGVLHPGQGGETGYIYSKIIDENGNLIRCSIIDGLRVFGASNATTGFDGIQQDRQWDRYAWTGYMAEVRPGESLRFTLEFAASKNANGVAPRLKLGNVFKLQAELITFVKSEDDPKPNAKIDNVYFDNITTGSQTTPGGG